MKETETERHTHTQRDKNELKQQILCESSATRPLTVLPIIFGVRICRCFLSTLSFISFNFFGRVEYGLNNELS